MNIIAKLLINPDNADEAAGVMTAYAYKLQKEQQQRIAAMLRRASIQQLVYLLQDIRAMVDNDDIDEDEFEFYQIVVDLTHKEFIERDRIREFPDGRYPNTNIIQAIKERSDLIDVIETFTKVYRYKSTWTFKCPLHADNHPSGHIYDDRWHCFQCNAHGDVIDAVEQFGKMDKKQAIKWLCEFYGIDQTILPAQKIKGGVKIASK